MKPSQTQEKRSTAIVSAPNGCATQISTRNGTNRRRKATRVVAKRLGFTLREKKKNPFPPPSPGFVESLKNKNSRGPRTRKKKKRDRKFVPMASETWTESNKKDLEATERNEKQNDSTCFDLLSPVYVILTPLPPHPLCSFIGRP